jgi:carboxylesterase type B
LILYVPKTAVNKNLPTLVWIHGGSFTSGSATGPGLDGSKLAVATNSIVAVVQYRLGGVSRLSLLTGTSAYHDPVWLFGSQRRIQPWHQGRHHGFDLPQPCLALVWWCDQQGHSGRTELRCHTHSCSPCCPVGKFFVPICHSSIGPDGERICYCISYFHELTISQDYGFFKPATQQKLNDDLVSYLNCASTDSKCLAALKVQDILDASDNVKWDAGSLDKAASGGEWFRPVQDGSFITSPLSSSATFPKQNKPILVTTVTHEAAYTIYGAYDVPVSPPDYPTAIGYSYTEDSTNKIVTSSYYEVPSTMASKSDADTRSLLEVLGTDGIWRCSAYTFARRWSVAGAKAYVGQFIVGSSYPGNEEVTQCTQAGAVCHQDDIKIVFGTVTNPTAAQSKATAEVQARYAAFMLNGSPNASNYNNWKASTTTSVNAVQLGNNGALAAVGGCTPDFWGAAVLYDYQIYGI